MKKMRREARSLERVWRAAEIFPAEPIVRFERPGDRVHILFDSGLDMTNPKVWRGHRYEGEREADVSPEMIAKAIKGNSQNGSHHIDLPYATVTVEERVFSRQIGNGHGRRDGEPSQFGFDEEE